jgi:mannose-6-phosphate isomerase-like protein (cupin superfamily)
LPVAERSPTDQRPARRFGPLEARRKRRLALHGRDEEALTIFRGAGAAKIEGHADVPLHADMLAYIPPGTRHNVTNTGSEVLEYVWVVGTVSAK